MNLMVVVAGVGLLIVLAIIIGLIEVADGASRRTAWHAIAEGRRHNWEEAQRLRAWNESLQRCSYCPFLQENRSRLRT